MKQWVHITIALAMWLTALVVLLVTNNDWRANRLDSVGTYSLKKIPSKYTDSRAAIFKLVDDAKFETGTCMVKTAFNATTDAACTTTRTGIVNKARTEFGCDSNRSPACNCLTQVIRSVADDVGTSNQFSGVFSGFGLNLQGARTNVTQGIEDCHWLHRPTYVADKGDNKNVRRTGLLFYLTTLTTFNLLDHTVLRMIISKWTQSYQGMFRAALGVAALLVGFLANIIIDSGTTNLLMFSAIVPVIFLVWQEIIMGGEPSYSNRPWLHPFYFSASLSVLMVLAYVENAVLDFDVIYTDGITLAAVSFLYLVVGWYYTDMGKIESRLDTARSVHDALVFIVFIAVARVITLVEAPYTTSPSRNYMWHIPLMFTLFAFGSVTWLLNFYREEDPEEKENANETGKHKIMDHHKSRLSFVHLAIQMLVLLFYLLLHTKVKLWIISPAASSSVQVNATATWLLPWL